MTFLNPLLLLGLLAAAIPIIIHLFNFRKPRRVDFSSLAFLKELQQSTMRRVRIKQWLLLLLRTLAIACLALAFARPTLTEGLGAFQGRAATSMVIVVDNSLSMTLRDAEGAYLAQAQDMATSLVEGARPGDEVFILTTSGTRIAQPAAFRNQGMALDAITETEAQPGAAPLARVLAEAATLLDEDGTHLNQEIFLISDLQRSTLRDSTSAPIEGTARAILLPVGTRTYPNVAVTDVSVESRIIELGQPVQLTATLVNYGTEPIEDYVASIYLEDERVAQGTATLAPDAPARIAFTVTPQRRGWLAGVVRIEDDAFAADNERYFTLHVPERRRLLVVRGEGQSADYLNLAFSPQLTRDRLAFDIETVDEANLAATALGAFDAVVLVGPRDLSSGEAGALVRYVREGGGLLLFPSSRAQAEDYNALLGSLGGGTFSGFSGELGSGQPIAGFDRVELEHPLFEGIFDQANQGEIAVESPDVFYAANYTPASGTEQTLIALSNGFPFLQELRDGRGAAFFMTVAPDPAWSDLPRRGLFIPLLYRAMYYLSSGESVAGDQLVVGQSGEVRLANADETALYRLIGPEGDELATEQRSLFGAMLLQVGAEVQQPGVYDVRAGEDLVRRVAFNLSQAESDLETVDAERAAETLGEAAGLPVRPFSLGAENATDVVEALDAERTGVELWNVFLLLALLFLVAEMAVARQWRPEATPA